MPVRVELICLFLVVLVVPVTPFAQNQPSSHEIPISEFTGKMTGWAVKGHVLEAKTWIESGDSNTLIISEIQRGEPYQKNHVSAIFGYRFAKKSGKWRQLWAIQEFNPSIIHIIQYDKASLRIMDADGIGLTETFFFYTVGQESGADPISLKMIFFWNGTKMPIRGKIPWTESDIEAYEKNLDPKLKAAPDSIQAFAIREWKRHAPAATQKRPVVAT